MYTDHQGALMISVALEVPPVSVHQCQLSVLNSATYQCLPVHINATYQCPSELPFSVTHQCHVHQCRLSVPPNSASQCQISVLPFSVHQ
ncbi:unnamed protein product [Staurois parvus]|uniref:Uncharacterized protein n=1 Tax=Staurois parvus TaxID=386267 RepID=A0ABN9GNS3_9NEOB|nr:unnamed protein product [Staurois parvus]